MTRLEIKTEVLVRLGKNTTSAFYTDSMLEDWINQSHKWAAGYRQWPFTEYMDKSLSFVSGTEEYAYPNVGLRTDSIEMLKIGTEANWTENQSFGKKLFTDYMKYRENYSDEDDEIFSDYKRTIYINPNCTGGTIYALGQLLPADMVVGDGGDSDKSVFSTAAEDEGDEAIIESVLSKAWKKEKKFSVSLQHYTLAKSILDDMWGRIKNDQSDYQTKDRKLFEDFDVIKGTTKGENISQF